MPNKPPTHRPKWLPPRRVSDRAYNHGRRKRDPDLSARQQLRNTARWQRLRAIVMASNCHLCEVCQSNGRTVPAVDVHHIDQDLDRFFDVDNLQPICRSCHARESAEERKS